MSCCESIGEAQNRGCVGTCRNFEQDAYADAIIQYNECANEKVNASAT